MNDKRITLTALADKLGRAKSGLSRLAKRGQIPRNADGTFNEKAVRKALASNVDPARRLPLRGEEVPPLKTIEDAKGAVALVRRVLREEGAEPTGPIDYAAARTAELILKTRERDLKMKVASGDLCHAATVHEAAFRSAREARDRLQNWPARVGPVLAAEIGVDPVKLTILLENHIRKYLIEQSKPRTFSLGKTQSVIPAGI